MWKRQVQVLRRVKSGVTELSFCFHNVIDGILYDCTSSLVCWFDNDVGVVFQVIQGLSLSWREIAVFRWFVDVFIDGQSSSFAKRIQDWVVFYGGIKSAGIPEFVMIEWFGLSSFVCPVGGAGCGVVGI